MFFSRPLLMLLVTHIHVAYTLGCSVCVIEPLITSPLKCPACAENGFTEAPLTTTPKNSGYYGEPYDPSNWTTCFIEVQSCNASYKYRTLDGSCNNLEHPTMGMANTVFTRLLPSYYQDNKHSLALGSSGKRPLSRTLRTLLFSEHDNPDHVSLMVMLWGQVVAHDTALSPPSVDTYFVNCCNPSIENHETVCLPIKVATNDYFYSQYNVTCLNEARSNTGLIGDCNAEQPRQQINSITHALDGSLIYGSNLTKSNSLREFVDGKLKTQKLSDGRLFLPNRPEDQVEGVCYVPNKTDTCYDAGDKRVNQHSQLSVLQTVLMREHNRIAQKLQALHKEWDDETLFQEARTIVAAEIQHITYQEWLVYYIGKDNMNRYNLFPKKNGYTTYSSSIPLTTTNSFVAAAYRAAHSGIQGFLSMVDYQHVPQLQMPISNWMNKPSIIEEFNNFDQLLLGSTQQPMQAFDGNYPQQITNLLFHNTKPYGRDLLSVDIERGRDHGLAPYIHYLEICTGHKVEQFKDLLKFIPFKYVFKLIKYYKVVEDIDLMVGGLLETKVTGTRFGPTFLCIITEQFYRKKWGDRFWYEVEGQPHTFTKAQLQEIKKASLSRLLCDSGDHITNISVNSFLPPSASNKIVPCDSIPEINLDEWK